ncbi:MAG: peptidoglycan DD-metalloendopeptidase family protein [Alphaproteobacteria bacterium]
MFLATETMHTPAFAAAKLPLTKTITPDWEKKEYYYNELSTILEKIDPSGEDAKSILPLIERARISKTPDAIKKVAIITNKNNKIESIVLQADSKTDLVVSRAENGVFNALPINSPYNRKLIFKKGRVGTSFYRAAANLDIPNSVTASMVNGFEQTVDFRSDVKGRDTFEVLYEEQTPNLGYASEKKLDIKRRVLFASLTAGGEKIDLYRFRGGDGKLSYYDKEGRKVQKTMNVYPVGKVRISAPYGQRIHPILGIVIKHKGVDFAAPRGTPIRAAASGIVLRKQWVRGYGKYTKISHDSTYSTAYAHQQRWHPKLKKGMKVTKGDIIGYVGSTGRSTGPHLHFEVAKFGKVINPLRANLPTKVTQLAKSELDKFQYRVAFIDAKRTQLEPLIPHNVATLDVDKK